MKFARWWRFAVPSLPVKPATSLSEIASIGPQRSRQLARAGIETVEQLLTHYPKRYEDRRRFDQFPSEESEIAICVCGLVRSTAVKFMRAGQKMFDAVLEQEHATALSPPLLCRWFNAHWIERMIAKGQRVVVYGRPKRRGKQIVIDHPEFEIVEDDAEASLHMQRLVPIHRATEGLSPRLLRKIIWDVLQETPPEIGPPLLPPVLSKHSRLEMLRQIHFPENAESLETARRHLVLEEFFAMQLTMAARRAEHREQPGAPHCGPGELMARLHASLPFPLTGAQQRSIAEIREDLASNRQMNRLLHGDVGAGKTLVALSAMLLAVEDGFHAALMAPTQILAEQHYRTFQRLLEPLGVRVALRTGSRKEETGPLPLFDQDQWLDSVRGKEGRQRPIQAAASLPQIVVGTHALLYDGAGLNQPGLVVVDEQHKFGVLQRARLRDQAEGCTPDVLVMTATPIPRTLTMTLYGDVDVSLLDEMPKGRGKIITVARDSSKLPDAAKFIKTHLEAGRQAYIVYPLIEASEKLEAKAASAEFAKWQTLLAPMKCALIHGRIPSEEKEAIMEGFRHGTTKALIATTVIEVGIDVPNATILLVENAERFGLAQLHQLRGRIGRGEHKSYCVLLASDATDESMEKLHILENTSDGFEIAEADLRIRGPGDLLGTAQTGLSPLKLGNLLADSSLMKQARGAAFVILERDPHLRAKENAHYRELVATQQNAALAQVS